VRHESEIEGSTSVQNTLLLAGLACLIAAIVGGGLRAFGIEIPLLASIPRQLVLGTLGVVLMLIAATSARRPPVDNGGASTSSTTSAASGTSETATTAAPTNSTTAIPSQTSQTAPPQAVSASVTFDTTTDNKDDDSYLVVVVRDASNRQLFAYRQQGKEEFKDPSSVTKVLQRNGDVLKAALIGGSIEVCITTTGNDTWNFNYHGAVIADDKSQASFEATGQSLSGHNSTQCTSAPLR